MTLHDLAAVLRRHRGLILLITALVAVLSLGLALSKPARYQAKLRFLVTMPNPTQVDIGHALAYDIPAIVNGREFSQDLAQYLAQQGLTMTPEALRAALSVDVQHEVRLAAVSDDPQRAMQIARATVQVLADGGLRYWGTAIPIADRPGFQIVILDEFSETKKINNPFAIAVEIGLRTLAGFWAACVIVFMQEALGHRRQGSGIRGQGSGVST